MAPRWDKKGAKKAHKSSVSKRYPQDAPFWLQDAPFWLHFGSKMPHFGSKMPHVGSQMPHFGRQMPQFGSQMLPRCIQNAPKMPQEQHLGIMLQHIYKHAGNSQISISLETFVKNSRFSSSQILQKATTNGGHMPSQSTSMSNMCPTAERAKRAECALKKMFHKSIKLENNSPHD